MTNNSGDMTNKISDEDRSTNEEIERMIHDVRKIEVFVEPDRDVKLAYALEELLSARETIRRLVENSKALAKSLESEYYDCDHEPCALAYHRELLAELEGNKFETAMKCVLEENAGAWKALADGEEGKG